MGYEEEYSCAWEIHVQVFRATGSCSLQLTQMVQQIVFKLTQMVQQIVFKAGKTETET